MIRLFHTYSFGNILEIARQKPDATRVAGLYAWNQLGRKVKKGERGIRILAPMIGVRRKKDEEAEKDNRTEPQSSARRRLPVGRKQSSVRSTTRKSNRSYSVADGQDFSPCLDLPGIIPSPMRLAAGTKLDGYEVLALLGTGGMGEVYRARDSVLKREVAIKVLPSFVSQDVDRLRRFEHEAQAAAALNHPNILAVFQLGNFDGAPYLVSELLEGSTLRQLMERGPLPLRKTIDVAVQIARGLAAAHEKSIVHRDLKPENLFLTKDGRIKILDFGLAKLMQCQTESDDAGPTRALGTEPGAVMGTAGYMAPEQVRGKSVDHRADIFAFGAILYEMLAGKRAFDKPTAAETMTAILNEDPPSNSQIAGAASPGLLRVVHRCLEKNPEQRFQSASDLAFALDALSDSGSYAGVAIEAPISRRSRRPMAWSAGLAAALSLAAVAYLLVARQNKIASLRILDYEQITHDGQKKDIEGTDGGRVYFNQDFSQPIAQVAVTGGAIVPIPMKLPDPQLADVSPDGTTLLVRSRSGGEKVTFPMWTVRVLGDSERYLADVVDATWAPDGESVAYSTAGGDLFLIRSDGTGAHKLATLVDQAAGFIWSPDGSAIRFSMGNKIWEISSNGSNLHQVLPGWRSSSWQCCGRWAPDGRFFFLSDGQIWTVDERRGLFRQSSTQPAQLTSGPILWAAPFPSKDGKKILAVGATRRGELIRFDSKLGQFLPFLAGLSAEFVDFSKEGRSVAYVSYPDGILWKANRDGSAPVQLTDPPMYARLIKWSPDGTQIVFVATPQGGDNVEAYIVSSSGGRPRRLLTEESGSQTDPNWSPDGRKIVFSTSPEVGRDPKSDLRIVDLTSHEVKIVPGSVGMYSPHWSPDGLSIAAESFDGSTLNLFDIATGRWSLLRTGVGAFPTWSGDSRYIYFLDYSSGAGVYRIRVKGGEPERIVDLKGVHYTGYYALWMGLDPTDAPLLLRDIGSEDIYALTLGQR